MVTMFNSHIYAIWLLCNIFSQPIRNRTSNKPYSRAQGESMKEQENKWTDLGLNQLAESTNANANS